MMEWIARAQRNPYARITGVVYLLYFLTAISGSLLVGWPRLSLTVNLINRALCRIDSCSSMICSSR